MFTETHEGICNSLSWACKGPKIGPKTCAGVVHWPADHQRNVYGKRRSEICSCSLQPVKWLCHFSELIASLHPHKSNQRLLEPPPLYRKQMPLILGSRVYVSLEINETNMNEPLFLLLSFIANNTDNFLTCQKHWLFLMVAVEKSWNKENLAYLKKETIDYFYGNFVIIGEWECAAGWGDIFTITGLHIQAFLIGVLDWFWECGVKSNLPKKRN